MESPPLNSAPAHRADIDGLRAVAVMAVVLYHAKIPFFGGGFVGVDVFFVISGFLITRIITSDLSAGRFSLAHFYERRIRRIFPALFVVMACSFAAGAVLLLSFQFGYLGRALLSASLFVSNIASYRLQGDYFAPRTGDDPLLHLWSLGIEEQFYLFFPCLMALLWKRWRGQLPWVLGAFTLLSFLSVSWVVTRNPGAAFFLSHFRFWELLVGALIAFVPRGRFQSKGATELLPLLGLSLILFAVFRYNAKTPFPGPSALLPTLGAALILCPIGDGVSTIARVLSLRPVVAVGLISYSLYLWHWPLLIYSFLVWDAPLWGRWALVGAALLLSWASWAWIENPFRRSAFVSRAWVFGSAAAAILIAVCVGYSARTPGAALHTWHTDAVAKITPIDQEGNCSTPLCSSGPEKPRVIVWDDSHGFSFHASIAEAAEGHIGFVSRSWCPPVGGLRIIKFGATVCDQKDPLESILSERSVKQVVILARWEAHFQGWFQANPPPSTYCDEEGCTTDRTAAGLKVENALVRTVLRLHDAGKSVLVVGPIPFPGFNVPQAFKLARLFGKEIPSVDASSPTFFETVDRIKALRARAPFRLVLPHEVLCEKRFCQLVVGEDPVYYDDNHLSLPGARFVWHQFGKEIITPAEPTRLPASRN